MSLFTTDTIRLYAESIGLTQLGDDVLSLLCHDVEYRVRELLQESSKFMRHSKRQKLTTEDVHLAFKLKHVEPIYGFDVAEPLAFKHFAQGNIYYVPEKEIDFDTILTTPLPKLPQPVTFTSHWLAIEGIQPQIPENPIIYEDKVSSIKSEFIGLSAGSEAQTSKRSEDAAGTAAALKFNVKHHLSKEHQMYFDTVTNCLLSKDIASGSSGPALQTTLNSLRNDAGIQQLLPYFIQFASEMVMKNLKNLPLLHLLVKVIENLLFNVNLYIEPYLHQLMPTLLTCVVGKRLCTSPSVEDHWSLREEASKLVSHICKGYGDSYPTLQPRVMKTLMKALLSPDTGEGAARDFYSNYPSKYGALLALQSLGSMSVELFLLPNIRTCWASFSKPVHFVSMHTRDEMDEEAQQGQEELIEVVACEKEKCKHELLRAIGTVLREKSKEAAMGPKQDVARYLKEKYREAFECFGEQLVSYINCEDMVVL